jgi:hypothetical protein
LAPIIAGPGFSSWPHLEIVTLPPYSLPLKNAARCAGLIQSHGKGQQQSFFHRGASVNSTIKTLAIVGAIILSLGSTSVAGAKSKKQKPAISMKQARATAIQALPGATIKSAELEHEDGQFIYSFDMKTSTGIKEVWVDAMTGKVTQTKDETPADERNEKAQERNEKKRKKH